MAARLLVFTVNAVPFVFKAVVELGRRRRNGASENATKLAVLTEIPPFFINKRSPLVNFQSCKSYLDNFCQCSCSLPGKQLFRGPYSTVPTVVTASPLLSCCLFIFFFFYKFIHFINLFLAALGFRCCTRAFSSCGEWGLLFFAVSGLLIAVASLVAEHGL